VVSEIRWRPAFHIIPSRYPTVGLFDDVADPADLEIVTALAAATNPRLLDEIGNLRLVRDHDRIAGPGTTPIMAAFTHAKPSRFGGGNFGIYYAASDEQTAIAETSYHRQRFLADAHLPDERLDMRVYTLVASGSYDDVRSKPFSDPIYDAESYGASQRYGLAIYSEDVLDGLVFNSVRRHGGECVAVLRPTRIEDCNVSHHLEYRFENYELTGVFNIEQHYQ
jgi:hypothetical protein